MKLLLLLFLTFQSHIALAKNIQEIHIVLGQTKKISVPTQADIHITDSKVLKVVDEGSRLALFPKKLGVSYIHVNEQSFKVLIISESTKKSDIKIKNLLKSFKGLTSVIIKDQVHIQGVLYRLKDWVALSELAQSENIQYIFSAKIEESILKNVLSFFYFKVQSKNLPLPQLVWEPVATAIIHKDLESHNSFWLPLFNSYGVTIQYSSVNIANVPLVRVHIHIAEVNKRWSRQIGLDWNLENNAQLVQGGNQSFNIGVTLKALESRGLGQVLAQPNLLCRSGEMANFHSGGEFPIKLGSYKNKSVVWKKHGVLLEIKPKADYSGKLSIEVTAEISALDNAQAIEGIPSLTINRINTHFDLKDKQTIALSGLIKNSWGKAKTGLPLLSQIPILSPLFSSQNFHENQSELIIFVTPEIIFSHKKKQTLYPKSWSDHEFKL